MNDKYKDSIYEELKGFFPEEYDLTPEELESLPDRNTSQLDPVDVVEAPKQVLIPEIIKPESKPAPVVEVKEIPAAPQAEAALDNNNDVEIEETEVEEETADENEAESKKGKFHDLFDIIEMFAVCVACIIVVFSFFARLTVVDGDSMNDTLANGEFLIISDFMYTPEQGDIIVLQDTAAGHTELQKPLIKRVIAVGGQSVSITREGVVTVTDKDGTATVIDDSFIKDEAYEGRYYGEWDIPEGYIFVMGDNRNHSTDSRDFRLGIVDERCVVGKAKLRVLPFDKFSVIENPFK